MLRGAVAATLLLLAAACGKADGDRGPGGVTAGEARQLDRDAAKLDQERPPAAPAASTSASR